MVIGVPGSLVGVLLRLSGKAQPHGDQRHVPFPMDAFRLVTKCIDRAEHLLSGDCIVQNDPAMTIAQFHLLEHQPKPGHRPGPAQRRHGSSARRRTPEPALIILTGPVETLIPATTLRTSCTTSR
jgi:hypothetical protein